MATLRLVKVKETTNNITRGIITFLNSKGHCAFRANSTGIWDPERQVFRRPNQRVGIADVICCLKLKDGRGQFLAVEIKNAHTKDRLRATQEQFIKDVTQAGGWAIIATSYGNFIQWYKEQVNNGVIE